MDITLASLTNLLAQAGTLVRGTDAATPVTGVVFDSREVGKGDLFVCKGVAFRPQFLTSAIDAGAVGYLCDEEHADELAGVAGDTPAIVTSALRPAMALISAQVYGRPDHDIEVIGITGTKGKSSVAYMLREILDGDEPYSRTGILGSIDTFDGVERYESHNTTPESPELWRHLANVRDSHLPYMVMEVSSHGLKYDRVAGLDLAVGVFLNIGRDHISPVEHPTFEDYFASKLRIFDQCRVGVVNLDTERVDEVLAAAKRCERVVTFSAKGPQPVCGVTPDVWATNIKPAPGFISFDCHTPTWEGGVIVSMSGLFNVDNALAAITVCEVEDIDRTQVCEGLAQAKVPGRMELIEAGDGHIMAIVDYAHNQLSFQKFFDSVSQEYPGRQVIAVFGAPGGKAQERREQLPRAAAPYCDLIIYTEEDPAHDPVEDICADLAANTPEGCAYEIVCDREKAIQRAVEFAHDSGRDSVLALLAKGDETRQHRGDLFVEVPTDGEIVLKAIRALDA